MLELMYETVIDMGIGEYEVPVEVEYQVKASEEWPKVKLIAVYSMETDSKLKLDAKTREALVEEIELYVWNNPEILTENEDYL